jgi:hypothetical protein
VTPFEEFLLDLLMVSVTVVVVIEYAEDQIPPD